ncbi:sigma-70 family RNA polymerase sigma factor [Planctomycetales bacterium ZRK34]|nr:sigma-70 family RNA polymerase sigma factor [Planctomycetales bacterium ZRK34]
MDTTDQHDQFMRLFIQHQPRIYAYIRTLVFNRADAEEVLQEVASVLWRRFEDFTPGTHFDRWAFTIAYHQVLYHRQKARRDALMLHGDLVETLADQAAEESGRLDEFRDALSECVTQLGATDRDLLSRRYESGANNRSVASAVGRSESAVSRALHRIYRVLLECIRSKIESPGGAS